MRFARALIATLGASTSLIAAGSVALLAVSTVIAFKGWPDISDDSSAQTTTILAAVPATDRAVRQEQSAPVRLPREVRSTRPAAATAKRRVAPVATRSVTAGTRASVGAGNPSATAKAPNGSQPKDPEPAAGDPVRDVTGNLGHTTTTVTKGVGEAVRPVSPALADTVNQVGETVQKVVGDVGETVGKIIDPVGSIGG